MTSSPPHPSGQQFYGACDGFQRGFFMNSHFHRNVGFNSHNTESKSMGLSQMFILRQSNETSTLVKSPLAMPFKQIRAVSDSGSDWYNRQILVRWYTLCFIFIFVYTSWHFHPQRGVATRSIKLKTATAWFVPIFRKKIRFLLLI